MTQPRQALVVEDLHKSFASLEVLEGISMTAHEHDVVSIPGTAADRGKAPCRGASTVWKHRTRVT